MEEELLDMDTKDEGGEVEDAMCGLINVILRIAHQE